MKMQFSALLTASLMLLAGSGWAASDTPLGTWKTIDDHTGKPRSIIQISDHQGELQAVVKSVLNVTPADVARDGSPPRCTRCSGERKNQPIIGMTVMWGVHKDDDGWGGGHILDPAKGSTYKVKLSMLDHGQKLKVRGYLGFSMLGRNQIWERIEEPATATSAKP